MLTLHEIAAALGGVVRGDRVYAPGPGHSKKDRSLVVSLGDDDHDGFIVNTFSSKDTWQTAKDYVRAKLGRRPFEPHQSEPRKGNGGNGQEPYGLIIEEYIYDDINSDHVLKILRTGKKGFPQKRWENETWVWGGIPAERQIPYHLADLLKGIKEDKTIYLCEGEKDTNAVRALGFVATCNAGGSTKWWPSLTEYFFDADVIIVEHFDKPGRDHTQDIGVALGPVVRSLRVMRFPDITDDKGKIKIGADAYDWLHPRGKPAKTAEEWNQRVENTAVAWEPVEPAEPENKPGTPIEAPAEPVVEPEPIIDMHQWVGPAPPQEWLVEKWFPIGNVTLISGHGQTGKSTLMLQLMVATVLALDWVGNMPTPGAALFVTCEEEVDRLWQRVQEILAFYNGQRPDLPPVTPGELQDRGLSLISLVGKEQVMFATRRGSMVVDPTPAWERIVKRAEAIADLRLIGLDPAANMFAGNHNETVEVTQAVNHIRALAMARRAAATLAGHLTKTAQREGDSYGGAVGWYNAVRSHALFKKPEPIKLKEDDEPTPLDDTLRVLQHHKWQYSGRAGTIQLQWKDGVFHPVGGTSTFDVAIRNAEIDALTLDLLRASVKQGVVIISNTGPASTRLAAMLEAGAVTTQVKAGKYDFIKSLERLLARGVIKGESVWSKAGRRWKEIFVIVAEWQNSANAQDPAQNS